MSNHHHNNTSNTELESWLDEKLRDITIEPYPDYNLGLLPDEDGYDTDKVERKYNYEEMIADTRNALLAKFEERERLAMEKFGLKKGVKYNVKASDKVIVITPSHLSTNKESEKEV